MAFYGQAGPGVYRYYAPDGSMFEMRVLGPDAVQSINPDGWTDTFHRVPDSAGRPAVAPTPSPPPPSGDADPSVMQAFASADAAGLEAMRQIYEGLNPPAAAPLAEPEQARPPGSPPRMVLEQRSGEQCVRIEMSTPVLNSDKNWFATFTLINECGYWLLVRVDSAEENEGEGLATASFSRVGHPMPVNTLSSHVSVWEPDVPLPPNLGFAPVTRAGEGVLLRTTISGDYLASSRLPPKTLHFWIVSCREREEGSQVGNVMFVSQMLLKDNAQFRCVPLRPRE